MLVANLSPCLAALLFIGMAQGCRLKCDGKDGIPKSLRPFFTKCLSKKLAGFKLDWGSFVNYVVWDDSWYYATERFFCKDKDKSCWLENLQYLVKHDSYKYPYIGQCIKEYMAPQDPPVTCEDVEPAVYRPQIYQKFEKIHGCPRSEQRYVQCLRETAFQQTIQIRPNENTSKPSYRITQLADFINKHRSDCRITQVGNSFIRTCTGLKQDETGAIAGTGREKRSVNFSQIVGQSQGGQLNFRLTGTGVVVIQPSKPITIKKINAPKCLPQKLQLVMRSRTVLSNVVSKCNADENKATSLRVSTRIIVAKPKLPGQLGDCNVGRWSKWFNDDDPKSGTGDLEYLNRIRRKQPKSVCLRPTAIQALVASSGEPYTKSGNKVNIRPTFGLSCHKHKQKDRICKDFKIRFCCESF